MATKGRDGRIRVLVVTHSLGGGGAERFASTLLTSLDRERFAPSVCLVAAGETYSVPPDVTATVLGYRGLHHLPRVILGLRRLIRTSRPDVVLSNVLSTNCVTGGALWRLNRPPAWIARVGLAPEHGDPWHQQAWARRVYPLARAVVSNSARMRDAVARLYPAIADRCLSLPNPTDFAHLEQLAEEPPARRAEPDVPTLLAVGRLSEQKRPDVLLRAVARVREQLPVRLWIAGEGPLRSRIEQRVAELGLAQDVELLGFQKNPFALMRQADLFVLTSDFEGLPNALIEAQGLGLPAVATRCPYGPDEILVDGVTGRLVPPGDAAAVAAAIVEILADPPRRRTMAAAATVTVRPRFDVEQVVPQWQALLTEAASV